VNDFTIHRYWIDVLLDDGSEMGCAEEAHDPKQAVKYAIETCLRWGKNPVGAVRVVDNDTDEIVAGEL
jgi:hypothetical protein